MANHTPAPWIVTSADGLPTVGMGTYIETNGASYLPWHKWQCAGGADGKRGQAYADAHLMAAAPDMYDALQWIVDRYGDEGADREVNCARVARAALTKIEQEVGL